MASTASPFRCIHHHFPRIPCYSSKTTRTFTTTHPLHARRRRYLSPGARNENPTKNRYAADYPQPGAPDRRIESEMKETWREYEDIWGDPEPIEKDDEPRPRLDGFFAYGEEDMNPSEDPEFNHDDISSTAHGHLEEMREVREFQRVIVWDMPLLHKYAKPFTPPDPYAEPLRFRYTSYMGVHHPAGRKVVVTFRPGNLEPTTLLPGSRQLNKLIKLLGVRYNPETDTAKMSCEMFPTVAQNKRYLGDMVEKILAEAKDLGKDAFEDVPFDFRHVKKKNRPIFPDEWKMTDERRQYLADTRQMRQLENDSIVEGQKMIAENIGILEAKERQKEPVMVPAGRGGSRIRR